MTGKRKYTFLRGSSGLHGSDFQIRLLTLCLLRGLKRGAEFELSSENQAEAGLFDDVVYDEVDTGAILMQGKHKEDGKAKIRINELFGSTKSEFQLCQYLLSFSKIRGFRNLLRVRLLTNISVSSGRETEEHLTPFHIDDEDILYCNQRNEGYVLTEKSRDKLRVQQQNISEEDLSDFLEKFQLVCIPDVVLNEEILRVLKQLELFDGTNHEPSSIVDYIQRKIRQWYMRGSGDYLDSTDAKAYMCLWRSLNYARSFNDFGISFRRKTVNPGKRLVYLVNGDIYVLGLIKVYRQFLEEYKKEDAVMLVNPDDDLSIKQQTVEAFAFPECVCLIVPLFADSSCFTLHIEKMLQEISGRTYKTVVLLMDKDDGFAASIPDFKVIPLPIRFDDLDDARKRQFLDSEVEFQGRSVTLKEALDPNGDGNEIIDEEVLLRLSRGEKLKVERRHEDDDIGSVYINRNFIRDESELSERRLCDLIVAQNEEKFVLISDSAGMGKTTVLTKIVEILQEPTFPRHWIIRLDLNRYAGFLRKLRDMGRESFDVEDVLEATNPPPSHFERRLLNVADKVVLITDAVDEVNTAYTRMVLKFLENSFARTNIAKIVVTTRPHLEKLLEEELSVTSFKLELFSPRDQIDFLTRYWTKNLGLKEEDCRRCEEYAKLLLQKLNSSIGHASWSLIGIPLQTKMVADIFQQGGGRKGAEWQGCREFLTSQISSSVDVLADINVAKLYEMFVAKKGAVYVDKKSDRGSAEDVVTDYYYRSLRIHKRLALETLLAPERCRLFDVYREEVVVDTVKDALCAMGIVQATEDGWIFSHQTFAEYFMATSLWDELATGNKAGHGFLQFLLGHVFVSTEFVVVRSFFENVLANETVTDGMLELCASTVGQISWNQNRNVVLLAEERRINTLRLMLDKSTQCHSYLLQIEDVSGKTALHAAAGDLQLVEYLVAKGADIHKKTSISRTVLHDAVVDGNVDVVIFLTSRGVEVDAKLKDGRTALHLAAENDLCEVTRTLIRAGADKEAREQNRKTPLHVAVENNSVEAAKVLLEEGADIGAKTGNGQTAVNLALKIKSTPMRRLLANHRR